MSHGNIFPPYNERTQELVAGLNKLKHPAANELINLSLPQESVDDLAGGLNRMKLDVVDKLRARNQDLKKANQDKKRLHRKLEQACQELAQTHKRLASSRDEYTVMEEEFN